MSLGRRVLLWYARVRVACDHTQRALAIATYQKCRAKSMKSLSRTRTSVVSACILTCFPREVMRIWCVGSTFASCDIHDLSSSSLRQSLVKLHGKDFGPLTSEMNTGQHQATPQYGRIGPGAPCSFLCMASQEGFAMMDVGMDQCGERSRSNGMGSRLFFGTGATARHVTFLDAGDPTARNTLSTLSAVCPSTDILRKCRAEA